MNNITHKISRVALCSLLLVVLLCGAASATWDNNTTQTSNETISQSPAFDIPDPRGILTSIEDAVIDKLTDWGYDPSHALFLFVVILVFAFIINYLTSGATARMQGGNKYLLFLVLFIAILWFLEVI